MSVRLAVKSLVILFSAVMSLLVLMQIGVSVLGFLVKSQKSECDAVPIFWKGYGSIESVKYIREIAVDFEPRGQEFKGKLGKAIENNFRNKLIWRGYKLTIPYDAKARIRITYGRMTLPHPQETELSHLFPHANKKMKYFVYIKMCKRMNSDLSEKPVKTEVGYLFANKCRATLVEYGEGCGRHIDLMKSTTSYLFRANSPSGEWNHLIMGLSKPLDNN